MVSFKTCCNPERASDTRVCYNSVLCVSDTIRSSFESWKTTSWSGINVEQMEMDCKKFAKDLRALDKEMRAWDTYTGVESTVKNMITSLKAVGELQNPAIRERHWDQLMAATGVSAKERESNQGHMYMYYVLKTNSS